jgi:hypothetical protein
VKTLLKLLYIFVALSICFSCEEREGNTDPNPDVPQDVSPFSIEVVDIKARSAKVTINPADKTAKYFSDVLRAEYYTAYNEQFGFQRFIDMTINSLMATNSTTKEEVISQILTSGSTSSTFTNLDTDSQYYAVAMGIDEDGKITTQTVAMPFKTKAIRQSDNTFDIQVCDVTYTGANYTVTPTNKDEKYILVPWNKYTVELLDDDFSSHCINSLSDIENFVVSGDQNSHFESAIPGRDYYLVAFGYEDGEATTTLFKSQFTTKIAANFSSCKFTFTVNNIQNSSVDISVTPSVKNAPFLWGIVETEYFETLVQQIGTQECMKMILSETIAPFATTFGNKYDALEAITSFNDINTKRSIDNLTPGAEYIPWAVTIDNHGNATTELVMGESFKTTNKSRL